jgi:uncharacterized protein
MSRILKEKPQYIFVTCVVSFCALFFFSVLSQTTYRVLPVTAEEQLIAIPASISTTIYKYENVVVADSVSYDAEVRFMSTQLLPADQLPYIIVNDAPVQSPYLLSQSVLDYDEDDVALSGTGDEDDFAGNTDVILPVQRPEIQSATFDMASLNIELPEDAPTISLVVTALGFNAGATLKAIEQLPSAVTLAFAPIAAGTSKWEEFARKRGHTTLLEIPMQPMNYPQVNPGDLTLLTSLTAEENTERLERALSVAPNVSGVTNYMGARFATDQAAVQPVMRLLKDKGYFFLENAPSARSHMKQVAQQAEVPYKASTYDISPGLSASEIQTDLERLVLIAQKYGHATGVVPFEENVTLPALTAWIQSLPRQGIRLVNIENWRVFN